MVPTPTRRVFAMSFLFSLFRRTPALQAYALLDQHGICRAFKQAQQAPSSPDWVAVNEIRLQWLDQPLPPKARIVAPAPTITRSRLLAV